VSRRRRCCHRLRLEMEDVSPSAENEWARSDPFLIPYCNASFLLCYGLKERIVLFFFAGGIFSFFRIVCV
jgi:hypothetical protein